MLTEIIEMMKLVKSKQTELKRNSVPVLRISTANDLAQEYKMLKRQEHLLGYLDGQFVEVACYKNRLNFFQILKISKLLEDSQVLIIFKKIYVKQRMTNSNDRKGVFKVCQTMNNIR